MWRSCLCRASLFGCSVVGCSALLAVVIMAFIIRVEGNPDTPSFPRGNCTAGAFHKPCCFSNPDCIGCLDENQESCVCSKSPYCCSMAWDSQCVSVLTKNCGGCASACSNHCWHASRCPGCNQKAIQDCVCKLDAFCCRVGWDNSCVAHAISACHLVSPNETTTTQPPPDDNSTSTTLGPLPDRDPPHNTGFTALNFMYLSLGLFLILGLAISVVAGVVFLIWTRKRHGGTYRRVGGYQFEDAENGTPLASFSGETTGGERRGKGRGKGKGKGGKVSEIKEKDGQTYFTNQYLGRFEEAPVFKLQDSEEEDDTNLFGDDEGKGGEGGVRSPRKGLTLSDLVAKGGEGVVRDRGTTTTSTTDQKAEAEPSEEEEDYDEERLYGADQQGDETNGGEDDGGPTGDSTGADGGTGEGDSAN